MRTAPCGCGTRRRERRTWSCTSVTASWSPVRFTPDGSKLVTQDEGGFVQVWALDLEDLIGLAHAELTRELSEDECRQYLRVQRCSDA